MTRSLLASLLLALGLWPDLLLAQHATLTGTVTDGETGRPLEGAHVFIGSSMIGAASGADGRFVLARVPPGSHSLYVSMLGYEVVSEDLTVAAADTLTFAFQLKPAVIEVGTVTVTATRNRRWENRLARFERLFLGESDNADSCRILNPEVLAFDGKWWGTFKATAAEPLIVENRALGYRLTYYIKTFELRGATLRYDGEPFFEELTPADSDEATRWAENRRRAFLGSFHHFMLTLLGDSTREAGFITYRRPSVGRHDWSTERHPLPPDMLLRDGPTPGEKLLHFWGVVEVEYLREEETKAFHRWQGRPHATSHGSQRSYLRLTDGPTVIDASGEVVDPFGVTTYGYFAFERIAELLPKEYRPD